MALSQRGPLQPVLLAQYPLAKYSYADTASDQYGSISWTHVQSSDLNAIIEKDSIQERLNLRVVRAQEQLEAININDLAREASQQAVARHTRNTKPLVAILVKDPCLAIRFPSGRDQVHRFQLKFASSKDFRETLSLFRELNCPFTETTSDHTARSNSSRPESSSSWVQNYASPTTFTGNNERLHNLASTSVRAWNPGFLRSHTTVGAMTERVETAGSPRSFFSENTTQNGTATPTAEENRRSSLDRRAFSNIMDTQTPGTDRPITAPSLESQNLDHVLPPKRDLPFSKPGPRLSTMVPRQGLSLNSTNNQDDASSVPMATGVSSRPATARSRITIPPTSSPARQLRLELEENRSMSVDGAKENTSPGRMPMSSPMLLPTSVFGVSSPVVGNSTLQYKANAPSLSEDSVRPHSLLSTVQDQSQDQPRVTIPAQQEQVHHRAAENNNNNMNTSVISTTTSTCPSALVSTDLTSYLKAPESERSQLVNNWICQQLEDEGFRALCQDVERVWQRIAFGSQSPCVKK